MANEQVQIDVNVSDQASAALAKIEARLSSLEDTVTKSNSSFKKIGDTILGVFGGNLLTSALGKVEQAASELFNTFIVDGVHAAQEEEDAINKLNTALASAGKFSKQASEDFISFAKDLESVTKFSDDAVIAAGALLESLARLDSQGLQKATEAAANMASALGIDLESAVRLVGKAANGEVGALSRYGIQVQKGATDAQTFANTLDVLNSRFGGTASAQVKTFSGAIAQLGNQFNNLQEATGKVVTENPVLTQSIAALSVVIKDITQLFEENSGVIRQKFAEALLLAIDTARAFVPVFEGIIKTFLVVGNVFEAVGSLIGGVVASISLALKGEFTSAFDAAKQSATDFGKKLAESTNANVNLSFVTEELNKIDAAAKSGFESLQKGSEESEVAIKNNTTALEEFTDAQIKAGEEGQKLAEKLLASRTTESAANAEFLVQVEQINQARQQGLIDATVAQDAFLIATENASLKYVEELQKRNESLLALNTEASLAEVELNNQTINTTLAKQKEASDKVVELKAKQAAKEREIEQSKVKVVSDIFGNLASLQQTKSKELFEIGKAAAIAQATIDGYVAVSNAIAGPPTGPVFPLNLILGASLAVKTGVQIANIAATQLATGIDSVPGTGTKDQFPALLAPNERVVPSKTNTDLTNFLANQGNTEGLLASIANTLANQQQQIIVQVGPEQIVNVLNDQLRSGRMLAV